MAEACSHAFPTIGSKIVPRNAAGMWYCSMTPSMVFDSGAISPADSEEIVH